MKDWDDGIKNTSLNNTGNANHEVFQTPEKTEWSSQIRKRVWNKDYEMQWKKKGTWSHLAWKHQTYKYEIRSICQSLMFKLKKKIKK